MQQYTAATLDKAHFLNDHYCTIDGAVVIIKKVFCHIFHYFLNLDIQILSLAPFVNLKFWLLLGNVWL